MTLPLEPLLGPLVQNSARRADVVLDLLDAAKNQRMPGRCVRCYFDLLVDQHSLPAVELNALRHWLEQHIEVVARDQKDTLLERMPLQLHSDDLETYCHSMMEGVMKDRAYTSSAIDLRFEFKAA